MLDGIDANRIIVGAYTDARGGICPMLAAHRCGGRTNLASFARAWDRYTKAHGRPRPATERELRTLRAMLETSLAEDGYLLAEARRRREGRSRRDQAARDGRARGARRGPVASARSSGGSDRPSASSSASSPAGPSVARAGRTGSRGRCSAREVRSRKRTASAMSSGRIIWSRGTWPSIHEVIGVSTNAGQSAVTWTPDSASSPCAALLSATTAAFVAE